MLERIRLKFGSGKTAPKLDAPMAPITVFVGPNNGGKSRALAEIERWCREIAPQPTDAIVEWIDVTALTKEEIADEISAVSVRPEPSDRTREGNVVIGKLDTQSNRPVRHQIPVDRLVEQATKPEPGRCGYYAVFLGLHTLRIDGSNRLSMLTQQSAGDLQRDSAENHLVRLFADNELRGLVRQIIFEALGKYFVIDPTNMGTLRVRLSKRAPVDEREEKGWEQSSVTFHGAANSIENASDGVKAFCGIVTTVVAGGPKIMLIDEPEAFLHPGLATRLGKELSRLMAGTRRRLVVSTHSANFLVGCVQSGAPLSIIRLTYNYQEPTARLLPSEKLLHLMRNPLLRSTGVLNALFYEAVIVAESDSDRAFYQEINERLLGASDPRGIPNCLFLNAQNKQTVWDIVRPLRELGIPAAGIVDIDVLKDGGQVWQKPLEGAFIPKLNHRGLQDARKALMDAFIATGKDMKRYGGVSLLSGQERAACVDLLESLAAYGVFVVPGGELESWLPELKARGHGPAWLIDVFSKLGESPDQSNYVRPANGDVWDFIGNVRSWMSLSNRKGIPTD